LLLTRWLHLTARKKQQLNELFALNRRVMKAYLLKESERSVDLILVCGGLCGIFV
jgi:cobyric acid synthase